MVKFLGTKEKPYEMDKYNDSFQRLVIGGHPRRRFETKCIEPDFRGMFAAGRIDVDNKAKLDSYYQYMSLINKR